MNLRLEDVLARRLRELAEEKDIALSHVADRAGVARSYLWRLLDGESSATLAAVQRLAEALGVPPLELLGPDADPKTRAAVTSRTRAHPSRQAKQSSPTRSATKTKK